MKTVLVSLIRPQLLSPTRAANFSSLSCKFVVIRENDTLSMIIGDVETYPYHAGLIAQFCHEHAIKSRWIKKPDVIKIYDQDVAIRGGGWAEIIPGTKSCKIYGRSNAYGTFDRTDVGAVLAGQTLFAGYKVTVE